MSEQTADRIEILFELSLVVAASDRDRLAQIEGDDKVDALRGKSEVRPEQEKANEEQRKSFSALRVAPLSSARWKSRQNCAQTLVARSPRQ